MALQARLLEYPEGLSYHQIPAIIGADQIIRIHRIILSRISEERIIIIEAVDEPRSKDDSRCL